MRKLLIAAAVGAMFATPAFASTITIGMTASKTGALNVDSTLMLHGAELWRDQVNARGGIDVGGRHYKVRFVEYDDQSQAGRVQQLYTRLITRDHARFLFSPYSSGLTATAAVISEEYGKIMLDGGGAEEKIFQLGNKHLFQVITPAGHYLSGAIAELKRYDPHAKVAFVYSDDPFSKAVVAAAKKQAVAAGMTVAMDESYPPQTTDFTAVINKVISSGADAFLGGGHYADGATLARQMHDQKADLKWVSILVAPDSAQFATLGAAARDITVPSQWEPQVKYKPRFGPTVAQFTRAFEAKYKVAPDYHAASGYVEGLLLEHAIKEAHSIIPKKVTAKLNAMNTTTFFGATRFSDESADHGLQLAHKMVLAQWQTMDGKLVKEMVWPGAAATAKVVYPVR